MLPNSIVHFVIPMSSFVYIVKKKKTNKRIAVECFAHGDTCRPEPSASL